MTALEWNLLKSATERIDQARAATPPKNLLVEQLSTLTELDLLVRRLLRHAFSTPEATQ